MTLPLFSLLLLGSCASSVGSSTPEETTSTAVQALDSDGEDRDDHERLDIKHVLLLSVDGLHQKDLALFVKTHPESALAELTEHAVEYTDAHTTTPSDSFPGLLSFVTGGTSKSTGVYYDDSYDRTLYNPGSDCTGNPGTEIVYDESIELDDSQIFSPINPANLPEQKLADGTCKPVLPHEFLKVNTIFNVIAEAGGYTAWADKHPAYEIVNGPSGKGVVDLYTPEVNSVIQNGGVVNNVNLTDSQKACDGTTNSLPLKKVGDYTTCEPAIIAYDSTKVQAVLNEIDGMTSDGSKGAPVPAVFGMNYQEVSVGEKLIVGGYVDAAGTPSKLLEGALESVDASIGKFVAELKTQKLYKSTLIIISAKHGQSPIDKSKLSMESGGSGNATVTDPLGFVNLADPNVDQVFSTYVNPNSGNQYAADGHLMTDDVGILWLQDQSRKNIAAVVAEPENPANRTAMFADKLPPGTIFSSNINHGDELADIYGDPTSGDPVAAARAPNAFIQPNWGVIYSGSSKKIAEHGGGTLDDTNVALLVANPALRGRTISRHVTTTQVAPTILRALDLDPSALEAVRKEHTTTLPGLKL
jgi:hypothetical protein